MKIKKEITVLIYTIVFGVVQAQQTGTVDYKYLGVKFTIPDGWAGQEIEEGFVMGSNTIPGFMFLTTHEQKTLESIKQETKAGLLDNNGTNLSIQGEFQNIGNNGVGARFNGTFEGQAISAYIIGILNPHGPGVTIISGTTPEKFSDTYINLAKQFAASINFYQPEKSPVLDRWKEKFNNARLTYMDSYYSSGTSNGGYSTGGGYSSKTEIDLCAKGYFNFGSNSDMSFDTGGGFGSSNSNDAGQGSWEIVQSNNGNAVLRLNYRNGKVSEYELTYNEKDNKTYLNGYRYYVTYGTITDDGPNCN